MALFCILRAYASLLPTQKIQYPSDVSFGQAHDFVLHNICLSSHFTRYPPSARYQLSFWKWIISQFEAAIGEEDTSIDDRLYDRLFDAMSATRNEAAIENSVSPPPPTYVTHFWEPGSKARPLPADKEILGKSTITLFESRTTIEAGTTGLRTWRASFVLAKFLISNPDVVRNSKVLELGSGTGFVGIVTASIQMLYRDESAPSSVTLTDVNEEVIQRCSDNLRLPCNVCSSHPNASVCPLDWTDALDSSKIVQLRQFVSALDPNVVLGADLIYHPDIIPALLATLVLTLKARSESATAYLALTVRNPHLFVSFLSTTAMYNLDVEELAEDVYAQSSTEFIEHSEGIDQDVKLLRIRTIAGP